MNQQNDFELRRENYYEAGPEVKPDKIYLCLKGILFIFAFIMLLSSLMILIGTVVLLLANNKEGLHKVTSSVAEKEGFDGVYEQEKDLPFMIAMLFTIAIISLVVHSVGLIGVTKEHYCLVMIYAIIVTFSLFVSIHSSFVMKSPIVWWELIAYILISIMAIAFAIKIKRFKVGVNHNI